MTFDIQRFSTHDGPGVRTVVFFKGCPLRCAWCENPESQSARPELFYDPRLCLGCLDCARRASDGEVTVEHLEPEEAGERRARPLFHRERVRSPETFRDVCPTGALAVVGEAKGVDEIAGEVEKDLPFYGSEGGVTLSGGEPFSQPALLRALMERFSEAGIRIAVETSLQVPWRAIEPAVWFGVLFLADLKHVDPRRYRTATGGNLDVVLSNFRNLERAGARVVVRIPVVPGFNDEPAGMREIIRYAATLSNVRELHLLPYHTFGRGKYDSLGRGYPMGAAGGLDDAQLEPYARIGESLGLRVTIGG